ncbi:hypothetical protein A8L45_11775 [Veronia pacifica]|uniref:N-acetyltransferase domain-containing protein n=2 Tax=Veronia pacifica TaxID=1080227 RepID=A0A1C3EI97_9GAMM|nr:hypothetical protein A8L45_11775 [Veronia pacifica]
MKIRKAQFTDSEALAALCITVWIDTYCSEGIEAAHANYVLDEYTAKNLKQRIVNSTVLVAEVKGSPIGLAILNGKLGEIETLYVLSRFKGLGAGKALVDELKKHTNLELYLTCWEGNEPALQFYKRIGFMETGETFFELDGKKIRNVALACS